MSWRPEEWPELIIKSIKEVDLPPSQTFPILIPSSLEWNMARAKLIEVGADLILTALRNRGSSNARLIEDTRIIAGTLPREAYSDKLTSGTLVFIPDDPKPEGEHAQS